jgi:hypothetical protein
MSTSSQILGGSLAHPYDPLRDEPQGGAIGVTFQQLRERMAQQYYDVSQGARV